MPKDFNELLAQDRQFTVQDQTFTWGDVRPEILTSFEVDVNGKDPNKKDLNKDPNAIWDLMDRQILLFIVSEDRDKWKKLREREENPVTIAQISAVLTWLMEEQSERPTEQPSPSVSGRGKTAASSKAA